MRLTRQTNYAIRMLMYCAARGNALSRVQEISQANAISEPFLFKILQPLVANGFIESVRGRNGGIKLAKPSHEIKLSEVVNITEAIVTASTCAHEGIADCPLADNCGYHRALNDAMAAFLDVLSRHTIADLVASRTDTAKVFGIGGQADRGGEH